MPGDVKKKSSVTGRFLLYDDSLSMLERMYIRILGAPISGLRIRCRRILPKINRQFNKILDVGSGTGVFTAEIAARFPESSVVGIDNSEALVAKSNQISQKAGIRNCSFFIKDALHLDYHEEYDLALCIDNLEHIEDDVKVLENIYFALKKGGIAIIHVPNYYRRWFVFKWQKNFDVPGHVRPGYIFDDLLEKLGKAGFIVENSYYTYGFFETLANNISYAVTGAEMKNKYLYALLFPLLNIIAYFGKNSRPKMGAGILVIVKK